MEGKNSHKLSQLKNNLLQEENNEIVQELKKKWGVDDLKMRGVVGKHPKTGKKRFKNIRSSKGLKLLYPNGIPIFLTIPESVEIDENEEYSFSVTLAPKTIRDKAKFKYCFR